ncbi:MAG TPA: S9 family peptidase [Lentimicrobium sp.]|nr:S9 family peptidase [Lentimicrobium sp.]
MTNHDNFPIVSIASPDKVLNNVRAKSCIPDETDFQAAPVAMKNPEYFTKFNKIRVDDYYWLKDKENPLVTAYLKSENEYAQTVTAGSEILQKTIFEEMKGRLNEEDQSAPVYFNGYYYYSKTKQGKQYKIYCRKKESLSSEEEVIFDINEMAAGKSAFLFADYEVSPDNRYAAYMSNNSGSYAEFTLRIRDLETGLDLSGIKISKVQDVVWANDSKTIFYTVSNAAMRPWQVFRLDIFGSNPAVKVFEEKDELFIVNIQKSKTGDYLFLSCSSFTTTEYSLLNANTPFEAFKVFLPRVKDVDYGVYHHKEKFFIQYKDKENLNGRVFEAPIEGYQDKNNWIEIFSHDPEVMVDYLDVYNDFYAIQVRKNGLVEIIVRGIGSTYEKMIRFPEPVYSVEVMSLPDFQSLKMRYFYTSLNRPHTVFDYEPLEGISEVVKETVIPSGFDPDDYTVERLYAKAPDGKTVPMSIVYRTGLTRNGNNPAVLYSYGAYGQTSDAIFMSSFFSLINRGFVLAIAQIRGGSDMGEAWYEEGKLLNKKNTFTDFIACSEHLISMGYTNSSKLAIMGGSAGGLLVTAAANMRPELFNTVVAIVPFVDVINTMLDPSLPLTTQEYEEWGDPNIKEYYEYMLSYSPYDNIGRYDYPNMLITAGLNDSQVGYHEPAKFVAKLRNYKTDNNIVILKTNMQSGHGGATGRFDQLREIAFELAFILNRIGIND